MKVNEAYPFEIYDEAALKDIEPSCMIVGWAEDAGSLGARVIEYLIHKLGGREFAQIDPPDFYPLNGVTIEDDIVRFPRTKFHVCPEKGLILFEGSSPRAEWNRFLNTVVQLGRDRCKMKELYTVGGMVTLTPHTGRRDLLAVANSSESKTVLQEYDLASTISYQTPPGQRPTLSSYLLWVARENNVPGASFWVPTPFYLAGAEDPRAWKTVVQFFDRRFRLGLDMTDLDAEISRQDQKIARLIARIPEIEHLIWKLERSMPLTDDENQKLVKEMEECLGQ